MEVQRMKYEKNGYNRKLVADLYAWDAEYAEVYDDLNDDFFSDSIF